MNPTKPIGNYLDVDSSILESNLRISTNSDEEELNKMLQPFENPSKLVKPFPGFCLKTKDLESGTKIFVNICQSDAIPNPQDITEDELNQILESEETPSFRIPMSIGEVHYEKDNKELEVKVYDIVIHPEFLKKVQTVPLFKNFLVMVVFEGLHNKYGLSCADEKVELKNKKAFGSLQSHRIQQRDVQQKMGTDSISLTNNNNDNIENKQKKPLIETIASVDNETRIPLYRLYRRKSKPNCLIGEFKFPDIVSAKQLVVEVGEDRIVIESASKNYFLDVILPHFIRQNSCSSFFNKSTKILTLTMPIHGG